MRETNYSTILATNILAIGHLLTFEINRVYLICGLGETAVEKLTTSNLRENTDIGFRIPGMGGFRYTYSTHTLLNASGTHAGGVICEN